MSTRTIIIDPITRISGFLEIQVKVENHKVVDARSSGLLFRGFEKMLKDKHPLDSIYFTQRICGICSTAHSVAASFALENALKVFPDENGRMTRDILHGCEFLQNHLRHFYLYTLPDYVDAPEIAPVIPTIHKDYRLPTKIKENIAKHYIEAIEYSKRAHQLLALLGGKAPHNHGVFVGGVTVNMDSYKITRAQSILSSIKNFIEEKMIDDVYTVSEYYKEYFQLGSGYKNLISYGLYDYYNEKDIFYLKPQLSIDGKKYPFNSSKIKVDTYYTMCENDDVIACLKDDDKPYSFIKAPRYDGKAFQVGPLARMSLSGNYNNGISTMDRTIARVLEAAKIAEKMENLIKRITPFETSQQKYVIPQVSHAQGLVDTTRGALGHWVRIKDKKIDKYNILTPSNWNLSPKDSQNQYGPVEKALIGTHIENEDNPIEIGRIVRSFDPCVSCATHVITNNYKPKTIVIQ